MTKVKDRTAFLNRVAGYFFDLDGVLWRGSKPIPGAVELINYLQESDKSLRFISNTSSNSLETTLQKFKHLGFKVKREQVIVASREISRKLAEELKNEGNEGLIYLIGHRNLKIELERADLKVITENNFLPNEVEIVVAGRDSGFSFAKMQAALKAFENGARLAAVNKDATTPRDSGLTPGSGAVVAALETLAGREADFMIGKPRPDLLEEALKSTDLQRKECLMIGDTIDSDIKAASRAGIASALVLTGNSNREEIKNLSEKQRPDLVLSGVAELKDLLAGMQS